MAFGYDFIGLDDDIFGDGGADTQVIDSWAQMRLNRNLYDCASGLWSCNFSPVINNASDFTTFTGIRPYSQTAEGTVYKGFTVVNKGQRGVTIAIAYQSEAPGKAGTASGANVVVSRIGGQSPGDGTGTFVSPLGYHKEPVASTYDSGTKTGYEQWNFTFDEPASISEVLEFTIAVKANIDTFQATTHGASLDGTSSNFYVENEFNVVETTKTGTLYWSPNKAAPAPGTNSFEAMVFQSTVTGSVVPNSTAPDLLLDLISTTVATGTKGTVGYMVQAAPDSSTGATKVSQCFFLRSVSIKPFYQNPRIVDEDKFRPNLEFGSAESVDLVQNVRDLCLEWRPVAYGPRGKKNTDDTSIDPLTNYGYAAHWPFVFADYDGTTAGEEYTLVNDPFYLNTSNPDLELRCFWLCTQFGVGHDFIGDTIEAGTITWNVDITIDQIADKASGGATWAADATSVATLNDDTRMPVWPAHGQGGNGLPPVLRGAMADLQGGKSISGSAARFWYKEGTLFEHNGDLGLLYERSYDLSVDTSLADLSVPFRLNIEASLNEYTDPLNDNYLSDALRNAACKLYLVGFCLVEKPVG